jgi:GT2 family glycosyltransferase
MKIGIITVLYMNTQVQCELAIKTLDSITSKKHDLVFYGIVNGITNDLERALEPYYDVLRHNTENCLAMAWNKGIGLALSDECDYVFCPNLDIVLHDGALDRLVEHAEKYNDAVVWSMYDKGSEGVYSDTMYQVKRRTMRHNYACFMVDEKLFNKVGKFDEGFKPAYCEDLDMQLRIEKKGLKHYCFADCKYSHYENVSLKHHKGIKITGSEEGRPSTVYMKKKWGTLRGKPYDTPFNEKQKFEVDDCSEYNFKASSMAENRNFLYSLVRDLEPKRIVELGTYYGCSYFAFAQAIKDKDLSTELVGVDTWEGESHTGRYGEEVFNTFLDLKEGFKNVKHIRSTFDNAIGSFKDGSIDVLMIDGLHTYEAVKHDFENWLPKLRENGIILMHDTNVYDENKDFGVHKYFKELEYPKYNFNNRYGLGVVAPKGVDNFEKLEFLEQDVKVYSAIYGGFDRKPSQPINVDYYVDKNIPGEESGRVVDNRTKSRYWKIASPPVNCEYSIWIDGHIQITDSKLREKLLNICGDKLIALIPHPRRDNIWDEYRECLRQGKITSKRVAEDQLCRYRYEGFPDTHSLYAGTVFIRNHLHPKFSDFNKLWWQEYKNGSVRDQLSLPYVLWKLNIEPAIIDVKLRDNKLFKWNGHVKNS